MATISITRALNELKLLDKKISKKINESIFMGALIDGVQQVKKEYDPKGNLQSVQDLINYRASIKTAIMASNAKTIVEIDGRKMTVVEAIETKDSIKYKKDLLLKLKNDRRTTRSSINEENEQVKNRLDRLLEANFGKDSKTKSNEFDDVSKPFLKKNEVIEDDPIKIDEVISTLEESIDAFESEVDFVLSESNALTQIEV